MTWQNTSSTPARHRRHTTSAQPEGATRASRSPEAAIGRDADHAYPRLSPESPARRPAPGGSIRFRRATGTRLLPPPEQLAAKPLVLAAGPGLGAERGDQRGHRGHSARQLSSSRGTSLGLAPYRCADHRNVACRQLQAAWLARGRCGATRLDHLRHAVWPVRVYPRLRNLPRRTDLELQPADRISPGNRQLPAPCSQSARCHGASRPPATSSWIWRQRFWIDAGCLTVASSHPIRSPGEGAGLARTLGRPWDKRNSSRPALLIGLRMEQRGPQPPDHLIAASRYRC